MNRRKFVFRSALASMALPLRVSGFPLAAHGPNSELMRQLSGVPPAMEDRILVIINLTGGNDGLNTVIPVGQHADYFGLRANIALQPGQTLPLDGRTDIALHPALGGLRTLYNEGLLTVVHSAGYPNPNLSHARSSDIWMTGVSANQYASTGWAARYLQQRFPGYPAAYPNATMEDPLALQIGYTSTPTFQGDPQPVSITINDVNSFYELIGEGNNQAGSYLPCCEAGDLISYVRKQQLLAVGYSGQVKSAADAGSNQVVYPDDNELAQQLRIVARLIHGGLKTKMYFVSLQGFDTHGGQVTAGDMTQGVHARLLKQLGDAMLLFQRDLKAMNADGRVLTMTFSEFGRRATSNLSLGTDHGFAAPMFLAGTGLKKQHIGTPPDLKRDLLPLNPEPWDTGRDIAMQIDYRRIYHDILTDWFGHAEADTATVLFQPFGTTSLLRNTIETTGSGTWTDRSIWTAGRQPQPGEWVVVKAGHQVVVENSTNVERLDLLGDLVVKPGVQLNIRK